MTNTSTELKILGKILRKARLKKGISQEKLAFKAEVYRNYIGMIERGEINPSFLILLKIANSLNINLSNIFYKFELEMGEK